MNRRDVLSATVAVGATAIAGCLGPDAIGGGGGSENPYKSVVRENTRALEEENLELLRETIHDDSPDYDRTIERAQQMWSKYDLTYELGEVAITERPDGEDASGELALQIQQGGGDCEEQAVEQALQIQQGGDDCKREARVRFVLVTKKESGPEFRDNRLEGVHTLRPSDDDWKIWGTEPKDVEYL